MKEVMKPAVYHLVLKGQKAPKATGASKEELEAYALENELEAGEYEIKLVKPAEYFEKG